MVRSLLDGPSLPCPHKLGINIENRALRRIGKRKFSTSERFLWTTSGHHSRDHALPLGASRRAAVRTQPCAVTFAQRRQNGGPVILLARLRPQARESMRPQR